MTDGTGRPGVDPATLRALTRARSVTRSLSDDLLTHLPEIGEPGTQRLLDGWVEQGADTLRALAGALEERLLDLGRRGGPEEGWWPAPVAGSPHAGGTRASGSPGAEPFGGGRVRGSPEPPGWRG